MSKNLFAAQFRWLSALPLLFVIALLAVISISTLANTQSRNGGARADLFDFFARISPAQAAEEDVFHTILIDAESTERVGPWPWPRTLAAELVTAAQAAGARAVVFAEPLDAKDPLSPETIGDFWLSGARDEALAQQLALLPATDEALAEALAGAHGAYGVAPLARTLTNSRADAALSPNIGVKGDANAYLGLPVASIRSPVNSAITASANASVLTIAPDDDGVFRSSPLVWSIDGKPTPSTGLEAARLSLEDGKIELTPASTTVSSAGHVIKKLALGGNDVELGEHAALRFYAPQKIDPATTAAWRLLQTNAPTPQIEGKVVLIGLDKDVGRSIRTARGDFAPVEIHQLMASQLVSGASLARPGWVGYIEALGVMLLGAAAIMWSQRLDFWNAIMVAGAASAVAIIVAFLAFKFGHILLDPIPSAMALFLGAFSVAGGRSLGVVLKDDTVRGSFHGALPENAMKIIREGSDLSLLRGAHRDISVLACELRITQDDLNKLGHQANDVANVLAAATHSLKQAIVDTGGAVEQADGGKVFAYYNAPLETADHVRAACSSALRLVESMDKINTELDASSNMQGVQVHLAIGVASGPCFVGPMGHGKANRYSAIGPAVEVASFLRRQAEKYGPAIICDEHVYRHTHHHFAYLELDRLKNGVEARPFSIFALVGNPFIKSSKSYRTLEEAHRGMLNAYREGDLNAARNFLAEARRSPGSKIALFDLYETRLNRLAERNTQDNWDAVELVAI